MRGLIGKIPDLQPEYPLCHQQNAICTDCNAYLVGNVIIYNYTVIKAHAFYLVHARHCVALIGGVEVSAEEFVAAMPERTSIACATLS